MNNITLILFGKFGSPDPIWVALPSCSLKSSVTHSYQCVQCFRVQSEVWPPMLGIVIVHADVYAYDGCFFFFFFFPVTESARKVGSRKK